MKNQNAKCKMQNDNSGFKIFNFNLWFWILTFELWIFSPVFAQTHPDIEVLVTEKPEAKLDTAAQAEVLRPKDIAGVTLTVSDILEKATGVQLKQYGGMDDFATVSIRGSTTDQVLIYLDGVLLNTAEGGMIDLSFIPVDQVERIEVYRGGSPGRLADSTPGGAILIYTKGKPEKTENIIRNQFGSFTTYRGYIARSQALGDFYYNASYDRFQSEGDFSYLDNNGTRANPNDDQILTRQNNAFAANNFTAILGREKKESLNWKVFENFFQKGEGIPGLGSFTSTNAHLDTLRNFTHLKIDKEKWEGHFFFDFLNSRFQDPLGEIGLGVQDNDNFTFRGGPEFHINLLFPNQILSGFVAYRPEFFLPTNKNTTPQDGPLSQRHMIGMGVEDEFHFLDDKIILDPSLRFQTFINRLSGQDPSLPTTTADNDVTNYELSAKVGVKISPWPFLSFKGNFYRGFRQPTFNELFGDRGTFVGNPGLQPEKGLNFDFGIAGHFRDMGLLNDLFVEMVYFRQNINDLIQFLQTSQFTAKAQNLNEAQILGGEFSLSVRAFKNFRWTGHYVYQSAKDIGDGSSTRGKFLPGRPKNQVYMNAEYKYRFLRPFFETQIISDNFLDSQNLLKVSHRQLLSTGIHVTPTKWSEVSFSTKNLLNERIVDIVGFPLPGRSYWGELVLKL
ncbi:MAG: hypothetical protein A3H42_04195 [Deltaproteobacteria bacterium RIFCSPLOWO2_02_FULL_46_8]|nr:MAG: hypothetical protein A3H42_04195 [Deltaproteobacteria bacterium RIFCSPLOWO2_02_FULL_46_8]